MATLSGIGIAGQIASVIADQIATQVALGGGGGGSAAPSSFVLEYLGSTGNVADSSVATFTGQDFGAAASDRRIFVGVAGEASNVDLSSSGVTIGSATATLLRNYRASSLTVAIVYADVATGTSGTVAVTWPAAQGRTGIAMWRATGLTSVLTATAIGIAEGAIGSSAGGGNLNINLSSYGYAMSFATGIEMSAATLTPRNLTFDGYSSLSEGGFTHLAGAAHITTTTSVSSMGWDMNGGTLTAGISLTIALST